MSGAWVDEAECRSADPDIFFPPTCDEEHRHTPLCTEEADTARYRLSKARKYCGQCPVITRCYALAIRQIISGPFEPTAIYAGHHLETIRKEARLRPVDRKKSAESRPDTPQQ